MTSIRTSLYMLIVLSVSLGALNTFFQTGKLQKYVKYTVSLIVVYCIFSTFSISDINNLINFNTATKDFTEQNINPNEYIKTTIESSIKDNIIKRFNIPNESISLKIETQENDSELIVCNIKLNINDKKYNGYAERLLAYLKTEFGCEIEVIQKLRE